MYLKYKNELIEIFKTNNVFDLNAADNICAVFFDSPHHISISDLIYKIEKNSNILISKNDVESIMNILVKYGFAKKISFANDEIPRFEPLKTNEHHDHFICSCCKKIFEFYNEPFEKFQKKISDNIGLTLYHKLELYGICNNCLGRKEKIVPLMYVESGKTVKFKDIEGGDLLKSRLSHLGFVPGEKIIVISNSGVGPVIVEIKGSRLALGAGESSKIMVDKK
ncbi:transcriptional repressor [Candidatus Dependentiae bacterium]|nr:transcriptional repressor [Candidatus Dependentiae bacterium]